MKLNYRILNVFTDGDNPFSGNPLCVFEDATGLTDKDMQNLSPVSSTSPRRPSSHRAART